MAGTKRVSIRHNKDGTKTKTTTITYHTLFGTKKSESYSEVIGRPKKNKDGEKKKGLFGRLFD